ncbi:hypothetical protein COO91_05289 [Nostoc flagelliforme CCNUN1]|uniref:Uncharacterized protein n=1 Tax=Nostoc flagelliforme CCNUN1 TaxID=2038116 RepID=A0A2K8SV40_9NOSO|nr:hypothetical protein COO91_05289 [Nostoc flagelliforme CCNUN1]
MRGVQTIRRGVQLAVIVCPYLLGFKGSPRLGDKFPANGI